MNKALRASLGRLLLYFRSRYAVQLSSSDLYILEELVTANSHPEIICQFLQDICDCPLDFRDMSVITSFYYKREILKIVMEWNDRPVSCCLN